MSPRPIAILFCSLIGFGLPASKADASPFSITLLGSGGSGGQSDDGNMSVDGRAESNALSASDSDRLGLSVRGRRMTDMWPTFGVPGGALSLIPPTNNRATAAAEALGPTAFLDLGDGEYLAVSSEVADSLGSGVPADSSLSGGDRGSFQLPTVEPSHGPTPTVLNSPTVEASHGPTHTVLNDVTDTTNNILDGVLANLSSGLIYSPPGAGNALADAAAKGLAPAADQSAQNPEPATLILLASALAITARRLRRPASRA